MEITQNQLTVEVISTQPYAHCPACGNSSDAVHCQYQRTVHDVPCGGIILTFGEQMSLSENHQMVSLLEKLWRVEKK